MEKLIFKKIDGTIIDDVAQYVKDWVKNNPYGKIIVGTDSQVHGRRLKFSTVIIMHYKDKYDQGRGAHVLIANSWEKRLNKSQIEEMPSKLWREAEYSMQATQMIDKDDVMFRKKITVHLDYSPNPNDKSNFMFTAGIGYFSGMGYAAICKPDSYGSTHTADLAARKSLK